MPVLRGVQGRCDDGCYGGCFGESTAAGNGDSAGNVFSPHDRWRAGSRPEVLVNRAFAGRQAGNPRKHWASGQGLRRCPFYVGFRVGVMTGVMVGALVSLRPPATAIQPAMFSPRTTGGAPVAGLKSLSIGHLLAGRPETRVNIGLAGRGSGDAHFTWGSGQAWRRGVS